VGVSGMGRVCPLLRGVSVRLLYSLLRGKAAAMVENRDGDETEAECEWPPMDDK